VGKKLKNGQNGVEQVMRRFFQGRKITADCGEYFQAPPRTKATGYFLLRLTWTRVAFCLVVRERSVIVLDEQHICRFVIAQAIHCEKACKNDPGKEEIGVENRPTPTKERDSPQ
jgi:hypothetical protein